jgi:hypothetical protein
MSNIKIPLSKDGEAQIEIDTTGGTIWVHSKGRTVLRVSTAGALKAIDGRCAFIDIRDTDPDHVQVTIGPETVVEA